MLDIILLLCVIVCAVIVYIKKNKRIFIARVLLPLLVLAFLIKGFFVESVQIASNSMLPTLEVGDFLIASKSAYSIRLPVLGSTVVELAEPKRGDLLLFRWSKGGKVDVKRLIGLPGDKIEYSGKILFINGEKVLTHYVGGYEADGDSTEYLIFTEDIHSEGNRKEIQSSMLLDYEHYLSTDGDASWEVPDNHYFVFGDNRDRSSDSRTLGFLPKENVMSKALFVLFNWNGSGVKWSRVGVDVTPKLPAEEDYSNESE